MRRDSGYKRGDTVLSAMLGSTFCKKNTLQRYYRHGSRLQCIMQKYPPCNSYALVQATAGVGTVLIWYLI